ncbi:hypothetical protein NUW54_g8679 [Trametes sanguinea]|uniref:Uncharacterized protein n=1 Tax=Trametes sanguinea TaxID=158606 RepID=A0ACC1PCY4_9APHY|nr:hypothetical protein NUW54_g8679 [Trametes sanguinea]
MKPWFLGLTRLELGDSHSLPIVGDSQQCRIWFLTRFLLAVTAHALLMVRRSRALLHDFSSLSVHKTPLLFGLLDALRLGSLVSLGILLSVQHNTPPGAQHAFPNSATPATCG